MKTSKLREYLSEKQLRGFLIDHYLDPDKDHELLNTSIKSWEGLLTGSLPIYYGYINDKWEAGKHPNGWSGLCKRCWIEKGVEVFHEFKDRLVIEHEEEVAEQRRKERIDKILDEHEKV